MKRCPRGTDVQTVIVSRDLAPTLREAQKLVPSGFQRTRYDQTGSSYRFRQRPPSHFMRGSFRTIPLGRVQAVIGCPRAGTVPHNPGHSGAILPLPLAAWFNGGAQLSLGEYAARRAAAEPKPKAKPRRPRVTKRIFEVWEHSFTLKKLQKPREWFTPERWRRLAVSVRAMQHYQIGAEKSADARRYATEELERLWRDRYLARRATAARYRGPARSFSLIEARRVGGRWERRALRELRTDRKPKGVRV